MQKVHGHVLETRDACDGGAEEEKKENPPQIALASERFLARSAPRVIDLSRARRRTHGTPRTSRTSRDAYAKRDNAKTSNSELDFPVGETFGFAPPTSDTPSDDRGMDLAHDATQDLSQGKVKH